jgi:hypothetical protein
LPPVSSTPQPRTCGIAGRLMVVGFVVVSMAVAATALPLYRCCCRVLFTQNPSTGATGGRCIMLWLQPPFELLTWQKTGGDGAGCCCSPSACVGCWLAALSEQVSSIFKVLIL